MPETQSGDSYRERIAALEAVRATLAREQAEVLAWYAEQCAAATVAVEEAAAAVVKAGAEVAAAEETVKRVDTEADQLWTNLGTKLSRRDAARRGRLPAPGGNAAHPADQPGRLLHQVRERLEHLPTVQVLAVWTYPLLAVVAAGCAAGLAALAFGLRPTTARIALLVAAPVLSLLPARLVARLQGGARLDGWAVVVVLVVGSLVTAALAATR